jgi:membrane protein YqaA with SNARE-associated domain
MPGTIHQIFLALLHLGPAGLVILGVLDSSFLFLPIGNDLLLVALSLRHREQLPFFVVAAASGSAAGVFLLDLMARKAGEVGIQKIVSKRRFEFLKRKMSTRAGIAIALACIAPPPFPFTPVVATASAFNYPRWRLVAMVFGGRLVRFTIIGLLALTFGRQILAFVKTNVFLGVMIVIIVVSLVGSILSVRRWVKQSRRAT